MGGLVYEHIIGVLSPLRWWSSPGLPLPLLFALWCPCFIVFSRIGLFLFWSSAYGRVLFCCAGRILFCSICHALGAWGEGSLLDLKYRSWRIEGNPVYCCFVALFRPFREWGSFLWFYISEIILFFHLNAHWKMALDFGPIQHFYPASQSYFLSWSKTGEFSSHCLTQSAAIADDSAQRVG